MSKDMRDRMRANVGFHGKTCFAGLNMVEQHILMVKHPCFCCFNFPPTRSRRLTRMETSEGRRWAPRPWEELMVGPGGREGLGDGSSNVDLLGNYRQIMMVSWGNS